MKLYSQIGSILISLSISLFAQSIAITGTVVDSVSSQAIAGATVRLADDPAITTTTNSSGQFSLTGTATDIRLDRSADAHHSSITIRENALTIHSGYHAGQMTVDVYNAIGARIHHSSRMSAAGEAQTFTGLWHTPGLYYVNVHTPTSGQIIKCFGTSMQTMRAITPAAASQSRLAKSLAACDVEIIKNGYGTKIVTAASETANLDTIRLKAISVAPGVWTNVTPAGISLDGSENFGIMDVITDPARPTDIFAFTCYQGVWKSTDCGANWVRITADGVMTQGRAWGDAIDPNPNRNPATPPTLWATQGYGGAEGVNKSTDGGVTWTHYTIGGPHEGLYSIDVDPFDSGHLIGGLHEATGVVESSDGGITWRYIPTVGSGNSIFAFFVNTGSAATTGTTWLAVGQIDAGGTLYRTSTSGTNWTQVLAVGHPHGSSQLFTAGSGVLFFAGFGSGGGVFKSTDYGVNWTMVSSTSGTSIVGTPNYIYASSADLWPSNGGTGGNPKLQRAPRNPGTAWQLMTIPAGMNDGSHRMAACFDGSHYVVVGGNGRNGIWRYVEP